MSIIGYVEEMIRSCERNPNERYMYQAYGAINYHIMTREHDPKEDNKLYARWINEWKPKFEKLIWGI